MKFLVDTQLPPRLVEYLSQKGENVVHTSSFPSGHLLTDKQIREIAVQQERIIITKDSDFLDFFLMKGAPPIVLLIKIGNCSNQELLKTIDERWLLIQQKFHDEKASFIVLEQSSLTAF